MVKNPSACRRPGFNPWVGKTPLEKAMASHSSILAWRTPWTEEPSRLFSPWGDRESDMTEGLTLISQSINTFDISSFLNLPLSAPLPQSAGETLSRNVTLLVSPPGPPL